MLAMQPAQLIEMDDVIVTDRLIRIVLMAVEQIQESSDRVILWGHNPDLLISSTGELSWASLTEAIRRTL